MDNVKFSFVMAAYNVEKYIREAIDSVINQEYSNWELIIIDDESTDDTVHIVEEYKDQRIKLIRIKHRGTCGSVRSVALDYISGNYVQLLDADDFVSKDLLKKYADTIKEKDYDILLPLAYQYDGRIYTEVTKTRDILGKVISGEEAYDKSLFWDIHAWMCIKTEIVNIVGYNYEIENFNNDEINHRKHFYCANTVTCVDGAYYYRTNPNSITHNPLNNVRQFTRIPNNYLLVRFANDNHLNKKLLSHTKQLFTSSYFMYFIEYIKNIKDYKTQQKKEILELLKKNFVKKDFVFNDKKMLFLYYFSLKNFYILLCNIKLLFIIVKAKNFFDDINNQRKVRKIYINENKMKNKIIKLYNKAESRIFPKKVIVMFDGKLAAGGLCDRIRGIISVYQSCKKKNIDFKVFFTSPFLLSDYMEPNKVNWIISEEEIKYNNRSVPLFVYDEKGTEEEAYRLKEVIENSLDSNYNQLHFYTNAHYSLYSSSYSYDFKELFKPSERISKELEKYLPKNEEYISVSFRFLQLLGDFDEKYKTIYKVLPEHEKKQYMEKGINFLNNLYEIEKKRIFVATDSKTFLQAASKLPFVFIVPGEIAHVDAINDVSFEANKKTFIDFYMIANASKVYLGHTGDMHYSGFPKNAALLSGKEFKIVEY